MDYATLADVTEQVATIGQDTLDRANRRVRLLLAELRIDEDADFSDDGLGLLRDLALALASAGAARDQAVEPESPLWPRMREAQAEAERLMQRISLRSLGLTPADGGGYSSVAVGRA